MRDSNVQLSSYKPLFVTHQKIHSVRTSELRPEYFAVWISQLVKKSIIVKPRIGLSDVNFHGYVCEMNEIMCSTAFSNVKFC